MPRVQARRKWPTYLPDVAYAIEGAPQPKRGCGRTLAEVARDAFLAEITLGIPPWCLEAYRPEHRPKLVTREQLRDSLSPAMQVGSRSTVAAKADFISP